VAARTILDEITCRKRDKVAQEKATVSLESVKAAVASAPPPRDFAAVLRAPGVSLIAEVKRAYFRGSLNDLRAVREGINLPVLRKDFVLDPYQVYQARGAGADAVLVIVAALNDEDLQVLLRLVESLGMAALVEIHNEAELERALGVDPVHGRRIIGINNRDLRTFEVDLGTTERLCSLVPPEVILVSESGIHSRADVARLATAGIDAMLVGEGLVRAQDVGAKVRELIA
jgi:indole-3-glycerol phosphate synthase